MIENSKHLPVHKLEQYCIPKDLTLPLRSPEEVKSLLQLLDVYMDDFLGLMQAPSLQQLGNFMRAVLHGIHKVFPPLGPMDDQDDKPISIKKLKQGDGRWATSKEILGWFFDGMACCMSLPEEKVSEIMVNLKNLTKQKLVKVGDLEKLMGKLMHATIGIPNGHGLLSPIIAMVATKQRLRNYKNKTTKLNQATCQALQDWLTLLPHALKHPTLCTDLLPAPANFGGFCDKPLNKVLEAYGLALAKNSHPLCGESSSQQISKTGSVPRQPGWNYLKLGFGNDGASFSQASP